MAGHLSARRPACARSLFLAFSKLTLHISLSPAYVEVDDWKPYTHAEGSVYLSRWLSPCVVTEPNVRMEAALNMADACVRSILEWASELELELGFSIELFVEPDASGTCGYYLVDHGSRVLFWLQDCETSELGVLNGSSAQNLSAHAIAVTPRAHADKITARVSAGGRVLGPC